MKREYPRKVIEFARRLHDEGFTVTEIRGKLAAYGYTPGWSSVKRWVDDDYSERERMRHAIRYRASAERCTSTDTVLKAMSRRIRDLRGVGLSYDDIAAVLKLDFDVVVSGERIRYACNARNGELAPRERRRVAAEIAEKRGLAA